MRGFQGVFTGIGAALGWFLGGYDGFLYALLVFIALDYLTGLMAAAIEGKISSAVGLRGICRKVLIFMMVALGNLADQLLIGGGNPIRLAVIFFYLSNEGISILENAGRVGIPIPKQLRHVMEQWQKDSDL